MLAANGTHAQAPDFARIADYLEAIANPARLELLHQLRQPRPVSSIRLGASVERFSRDGRAITRQAVRKHLSRLVETGLVTTQRGRHDGLLVDEHVVNHQVLYALLEELRRVTQLTPTVPPPPAATFTGPSAQQRAKGSGARLIVVYGARLGQTFTLDPRTTPSDRGWVIGRREGLAVSLDYDPFVSQEHAEVVRDGERFGLLDLRSNKNGTELNWEALPRGGSAPLAHGDVVGLGRTLLLFRQQ